MRALDRSLAGNKAVFVGPRNGDFDQAVNKTGRKPPFPFGIKRAFPARTDEKPQGKSVAQRAGNTIDAKGALRCKTRVMSSRIATIALVVADYSEAVAFYCDRLGFSIVADTDLGGDKRWLVIAPPGGGARLLLARAEGPEQLARVGDQTGGRVGFFLETDDFARDFKAFSEAGVRFLEAPRHEPYGSVAVFEDLYGNKWDLIEPKG